jgi:asparagine synthase (glutamine-hydrolysing)
MCGIAGVVFHDRARAVDPGELKRMCDAIVHRGPDDEGFFLDGHVGLGVRRLSIIDLVTGHQPIGSEDGRVWVVFNGEIYNYRELRRELEARGHTFRTGSDTEVIVHAYEEDGEDCVKRFNGMFAFALWDRRDRRLIIARDRLGVKPLYYFLDDHRLVFGSELKAILEHRDVPRSIDREALDGFLTFEYVPAPLSIFEGIRKLPPGHLLCLEGGKAAVRRYWDLRFAPARGGERELGPALYDLLKDAVRLRLVSDVPLGAFLSGGIDSSTIVCMMSELMDRPVKTFSIGFDDPSYDELGYARMVAARFHTDHQELVIRPNVADLVQGLVRHLDEPLADVSVFPTYLVSELARRDVTVVLSGDGGDELFAGYDWYVADKLARYYARLPARLRTAVIPALVGRLSPGAQKKGPVNMLKRFVEGAALPERLEHFRWSMFLTETEKRALYGEDLRRALGDVDGGARVACALGFAAEADPLWRQQVADIKTYLADDILVKVDRMSMAHSLEARTPFLDYRVVEFAAALPSALRLRGFTTKYLLRRAMAAKLPRAVLTRGKQGFSIPMKNWLRHELRPLMEDVLSPARLRDAGLFDPAYVETLKAQHLAGVANHAHRLWSLMIFEIWRSLYLR